MSDDYLCGDDPMPLGKLAAFEEFVVLASIMISVLIHALPERWSGFNQFTVCFCVGAKRLEGYLLATFAV